MTNYKTYKVTLKIKSSVITPFQADTIFGTLCWGIRFLEKEEELKKFIDASLGEYPPLIISDGFPEGYLIKPVLEPLKSKESEELARDCYGKEKRGLIKGIMKLKELNRIDFISKDYLLNHIDPLSCIQMGRDFLTGGFKEPEIESQTNLHNTFNRLIARVREGGLFSETETYYSLASRINFYIKLNETVFPLSRLENLLKGYLEISGYGADKSVGKGQIEFMAIEDSDLSCAKQPNAFISLSSFVPDSDDPANGFYIPLIKYGKLGEHYASSKINKLDRNNRIIGLHPFKKPLYMFKAGSVFFLDGKPLKEYYGQIIKNVHWDTEIIHYGLAFPLGVKIEETMEGEVC
ncbi:MAG: hypothetical protein AB1414_01495 [bacterium]